jgi:HAD superfamily hydrolase (TIGR01509 family)
MHWRFLRPQIPVVERFCDRVLSYELSLAKPDPEVFRAALRRVGNPPPECCVFFDDMLPFVQVARTLGIQAEVFTTAAHFREQLARLGLTA